VKTVWTCMGLAVESPWLALGDPVLCMNGLRKQSSACQALSVYLIWMGGCWLRAVTIKSLLMSGFG